MEYLLRQNYYSDGMVCIEQLLAAVGGGGADGGDGDDAYVHLSI